MNAMVALVGRPNTGKSTLFNRFVGGRVAITLQQPGITRDRNTHEAEWLGRRFLVTDTGGLVPDSSEEIAREVERQVQIALKEAKVVVLVVDGAAGLMPLDEEIAARMRRAGVNFIVAVNKCDIRRTFDPSDFHKLGASALFPISAEAGTGVDELLDAVLARLPETSMSRRREVLTLAILGRPNVGKSSLMNRLMGRDRSIVTSIPGTTRDVIEDTFEYDGRHYRLLDTAGIRRKSRVEEPVEYYSVTRAIDQIARCDVAVVMFDTTDGPNNQDKRVINLVEARSKGMVLVANKSDLVRPDLKEKVRDWVKKELAFVDFAPVVFTSVLEARGVNRALKAAADVWDSGGKQVPTTKLRTAVLERLQKSPPRFDVRVLGLTQVGTRPPVFRLRVSNPERVVQSYERRVLADIRRSFRFTGYPIRLRVTR
jgi:GTP-binding protein